ATGTFQVSASDLAGAASDGVVEIAVQNSIAVGPICGVNRHTVRLRYNGPINRLDFGGVFVGDTRSLSVILENVGTEVLHLSAISSDRPDFVPPAASISIPPGGAVPLATTFAPTTAGLIAGTLTIVSDDPDSPVESIPFSGTGLTPPVIDPQPASLAA